MKIHDELQEERPKVSAILHDIDKLLPYVSNVHTALLMVHCTCTHTHTHRAGKNRKRQGEREKGGVERAGARKRHRERCTPASMLATTRACARTHAHTNFADLKREKENER